MGSQIELQHVLKRRVTHLRKLRSYLLEPLPAILAGIHIGLIKQIKPSDFRIDNACTDLDPKMPTTVEKSIDLSFPNSSILLSPGFSSFDQFENYEDRGNVFKKIITEMNYDK